METTQNAASFVYVCVGGWMGDFPCKEMQDMALDFLDPVFGLSFESIKSGVDGS